MNPREILELGKKHGFEKWTTTTTTKGETPWESEGSFEMVWEVRVFIWGWVGAGSARGHGQLGAAMRRLRGHGQQPPKPSHVLHQGRSIRASVRGEELMKRKTGCPACFRHSLLHPFLASQIPELMDYELGSWFVKDTSSQQIKGGTFRVVIWWSVNKWEWLAFILQWLGLSNFLLKSIWRVTHASSPIRITRRSHGHMSSQAKITWHLKWDKEIIKCTTGWITHTNWIKIFRTDDPKT